MRGLIFSYFVHYCHLWAVLPRAGLAQTPDESGQRNLPSAPQPQTLIPPRFFSPEVTLGVSFPHAAGKQTAFLRDPQVTPAAPTPRPDATDPHAGGAVGDQEQSSDQRRALLALAQHQVYRETRAAELPNFNGAMTAVDANEGSRIGAGSLTASRLLEHAGAGVTLANSSPISGAPSIWSLLRNSKRRRKMPMLWQPRKISFSPRTRLSTTRCRRRRCSKWRNRR